MSASTPAVPPAAPKKLGFWRKMAYGTGDLGSAIAAGVNGFFLNPFLLDVAGLRPGVIGTIFLVSRIWDAINDPAIGRLSDRTRTRWGRRRPWILLASLPFGLAFFAQWLVPPLDGPWLIAYYLVIALVYYLAFTAVNVPYTALTPELTQDYDDRTSLNSFRFSFSILGSLGAVAMYQTIVSAGGDPFTGHMIMAAIYGTFIALSGIIVFFGTRERVITTDPNEGPGFWEGMRMAMTNRAFVLVTVIYLISWLCIQFVQANLFLYVKYWIGAEESFTILVIAVQLSAFIFLVFWSWLSAKIGKQQVYYVGMSLWVVVSGALFFVQPGQLTVLAVLAFFAGAGVAVGYLIPWSMLPDVVDYDELQTGERREGIYYGLFVFLQKTGIALGLLISNYILEFVGYINEVPGQPTPIQNDGTLLALRLFVSLVPAVLLLLSFSVVAAYPITRARYAEIRAELDRRKDG